MARLKPCPFKIIPGWLTSGKIPSLTWQWNPTLTSQRRDVRMGHPANYFEGFDGT